MHHEYPYPWLCINMTDVPPKTSQIRFSHYFELVVDSNFVVNRRESESHIAVECMCVFNEETPVFLDDVLEFLMIA